MPAWVGGGKPSALMHCRYDKEIGRTADERYRVAHLVADKLLLILK